MGIRRDAAVSMAEAGTQVWHEGQIHAILIRDGEHELVVRREFLHARMARLSDLRRMLGTLDDVSEFTDDATAAPLDTSAA